MKPNEKPDRIAAFGFGKGNEVEMYVLKPTKLVNTIIVLLIGVQQCLMLY